MSSRLLNDRDRDHISILETETCNQIIMDDSSSPESASASMTFFTSPTSGDDTFGDYDGFVKEDSDSPPSEEDKRHMIQPRRLPSKQASTSPTSGRQLKSTKLTAKSIASVSRASAGHSSHLPIIPRKAEDWDPWKTILHELYITQNRILRDIINIMDTTYNLKAT